MVALEHLGFGPCYHMKTILQKQDPNEIKTWFNLGEGSASLDDMRELLKDYNSILDYPAAIYYEKLYEAYPDAKFILTTRDPVKWETSMRATIMKASKKFQDYTDSSPFFREMVNWLDNDMESRYHRNRLSTDTQGEILRHNQRVKDTIPSEKLLVYDISQGWGPLTEFLQVDKPITPFPHVNDTADFIKQNLM